MKKILAVLLLALLLPMPVLANPCSCVITAREYGVDIPFGMDARDFKANTTIHVGALALFQYENGVSHVAVVTSFEKDGYWVYEGNYEECEITRRFIKYDNPNFRGWWKQATAPNARSSAFALTWIFQKVSPSSKQSEARIGAVAVILYHSLVVEY